MQFSGLRSKHGRSPVLKFNLRGTRRRVPKGVTYLTLLCWWKNILSILSVGVYKTSSKRLFLPLCSKTWAVGNDQRRLRFHALFNRGRGQFMKCSFSVDLAQTPVFRFFRAANKVFGSLPVLSSNVNKTKLRKLTLIVYLWR